jgi:hypothetical protein
MNRSGRRDFHPQFGAPMADLRRDVAPAAPVAVTETATSTASVAAAPRGAGAGAVTLIETRRTAGGMVILMRRRGVRVKREGEAQVRQRGMDMGMVRWKGGRVRVL